MKKENVRKMTVLFLAMGLVGIGSAATQAAEPITITSDQGSEATSIESLCGKGILSKKWPVITLYIQQWVMKAMLL